MGLRSNQSNIFSQVPAAAIVKAQLFKKLAVGQQGKVRTSAVFRSLRVKVIRVTLNLKLLIRGKQCE